MIEDEIYYMDESKIDKIHDILQTKDKEDYRDIFFLINNCMSNGREMIAAGKGVFDIVCIHDTKERSPELESVIFPVKLQEKDCVLFTGEISKESNYWELFYKLNPKFKTDVDSKERKSLSLMSIINPPREDITDRVYSKKVYMLMEHKNIRDRFSIMVDVDRIFYFCGKIIHYEGNYFVLPYAVWKYM